MEWKKERDLKRASKTPTVHSLAISLRVCVCMFMPVWFTIILCKQSCGSGSFLKNLVWVNYTQTCLRISTALQRWQQDSVFILKDVCVTVNITLSTDKIFFAILSFLICFISCFHSLSPPFRNALMHGTPFIPITWVEVYVFDLELCLVVIWDVLPGGQKHLTFWKAEGHKSSSCERTPVKNEENEKTRIVWLCLELKVVILLPGRRFCFRLFC